MYHRFDLKKDWVCFLGKWKHLLCYLATFLSVQATSQEESVASLAEHCAGDLYRTIKVKVYLFPWGILVKIN